MVINDHICLALPNPLNANFWPFETYTQSGILMSVLDINTHIYLKTCYVRLLKNYGISQN